MWHFRKIVIGLAFGILVLFGRSVIAHTLAEQDRKVLLEACQSLKANGKTTVCLNILQKYSGHGEAEVAGKTGEVIALRGVPFDVPGSGDALVNLCLSTSNKRYSAEQLKKDETWCKIAKGGRIAMPAFDYGNLNDYVAIANVDSEGALTRVEITGHKSELLQLASVLAEKYGAPLIIDSQTENRVGTKFDKKTFVWVDKKGTRITVESLYERIDQGRVFIESASEVKMREAAGQMKSGIDKGKL